MYATFQDPLSSRTNNFKDRVWKLKVLFAGLLLSILLIVYGQTAPAIAGQVTSTKGLMSMEESTVNQTNKAIALRFAKEGWGTSDGWEKVWDELMAPNVVYHFNSFSEPIVGLEANKQFNTALFQGFPDIKNTVEDVLADGNKVVYRSTLQGTNTGEFLGIPPTGKSAKVNDFTLLRIENGKIAEWWYETNLLEVMKQLGLIGDLG